MAKRRHAGHVLKSNLSHCGGRLFDQLAHTDRAEKCRAENALESLFQRRTLGWKSEFVHVSQSETLLLVDADPLHYGLNKSRPPRFEISEALVVGRLEGHERRGETYCPCPIV